MKCEFEALLSVKQENWEYHSDLNDLENESNRCRMRFNNIKCKVMNETEMPALSYKHD